jgi:WD40 repeat protein
MSDFDPYHKWLGIPETARPVSKYRLLGIVDFESDRDVISAAAERQTIYLRTLQAGEHEVLVAQLLNEVSQARVTLLNADQKTEYDEELRQQKAPEPVPEPAPVPIPVVQTSALLQNIPLPPSQTSTPFATPQISITTPRSSKRRVRGKVFKVAVASVIGTVTVITLILALSDYSRTPPNLTPEQLLILEEERVEVNQLNQKQVEIDQLVDNAVRASDKDDYEEADNLFNQALTLGASGDANMWRAYHESGSSYEKRGDLQKGLDKFQVAVSLARSPEERGWSTKDEGILLIRLGEDAAGFKKIQEAQELIPDDPWMPYYRGRELRNLRRYDEAVPFLEQSIKLGSTSGWAQNDLADLKLYHIPDFEKAYELLQKVEQFDLSGNTAYWKRRAYASSKLGNWQDVLTETQRGLAIESDDKYDKDLLEMQSLAREKADQITELDSANQVSRLLWTFEEHEGEVFSVAFSPNGNKLASAGMDSSIKVLDTETGVEILTMRGHASRVSDICFTRDGTKIISGSADGTIKIWNSKTGEQLKTIKASSSAIFSIALSLDGKRIAASSETWTVKRWDTETGIELRPAVGNAERSFICAESPDGESVAAGNENRTVEIWGNETDDKVRTLEGHKANVWAIAFSPNGRLIASGSRSPENVIKVWDRQTGVESMTLHGHIDSVWSVDFSPDSQKILSASTDGTIKIWDFRSGIELLTLKGHSGRVSRAVFSPDGKLIASASADGTVKLWNLKLTPANTLPSSLQQGLVAYYPFNG